MLVTGNLKIYTPKYCYKRDTRPQNHHVTTKPTYKTEISNICYQPFFSGKEMSDEEFAAKKLFLENFYNYRQNQNNEYLKSIFDNCNKGNINLATTLLTDRSIDKFKLDIPEILSYAADGNSEFIEKLCRDKNFPPKLLTKILPLLKKENIPFANILYEEDALGDMKNVLTEFDKDKISGICAYLNRNLLSQVEEYPQKTVDEIKNLYNINDEINILKEIYNDNISLKRKINIFDNLSEKALPILIQMYNNPNFANNVLIFNLLDFDELFELFEDGENIKTLIDKLYSQQKLCLKNPDKYINSGNLDPKENQNRVKAFFARNFTKIMLAASVLDKEALDILFRMRFNEVKNYINDLSNFDENEIKTLKKMVASKNIDDKPFLPTQKIEFLELIKAYKNNKIPLTKINEMLDNGKIDITELHTDLLKQIFLNLRVVTDSEINSFPPQKLLQWDISKIHLLASQIEKSENKLTFKDLLNAATFNNFNDYILNPYNIYGQQNSYTKKLFNAYNLNYNNWLKPDPVNNIQLKIQNFETSHMPQQIAKSIEEDIEYLRQINPSLAIYVDKVLNKYIENNQFKIPERYITSPKKLECFVSGLIKNLNRVWTRAEKHISENKVEYPDNNVPNKAESTLVIKDHLEQKLVALLHMDNNKQQNLDLTIKMWDRIPQKDLFQGNYSTCCIGMGKINGKTMPNYLLYTAFNMIEIKDNKTDTPIGNALCYWVGDGNGNPALVIDNIEITNKLKLDTENGKKIREAILQYARNIVKTVSANKNSRILLGKNFNDIPTKDLKLEKEHVCFIGEINNSEIYLDLYDGWTRKDMKLYNCDTEAYSF